MELARLIRGRGCLLGIALWITVPAMAVVRLPALFSDGMVLQRDRGINVWGWAEPGERVRVSFHAQEVHGTADAGGSWLVQLAPETAQASGAELRIAGRNEVVLRDVVVGDVWICAGQSNMEAVVRDALDARREIATARFAEIRQFKIARQLAEHPQEAVGGTGWRRALPDQVGDFTAVGYFFAREFFRATGVPVGLINCSWSGTPVEPWMSPESLAENAAFQSVAKRWQADLAAYPARRGAYEDALAEWKQREAAERTKGPAAHAAFLKAQRAPRPPITAPDHPYPSNPSGIYHGMVHPLRHAAIRGVLWYQGEANAVRAAEYAALFQASIRGWRATFRQPELPFLWVQIANFEVDTDWPRLREAQSSALELPHTGEAIAIDIGDPHDIHPANKQEVGRRLALIALANLEHREFECSGPRLRAVTFTDGTARVSFAHAAGLHARSGPVGSLELAGADRVFRPAEGRIEGETLVVRAADVPAPVAVRYAWRASPRANLYNLAGLPAAPFRSDDW